MRLDEVVRENTCAHGRLESAIADIGLVVNKVESGQASLSKTVKIGAVLVAIIPTALQAYTSIQSAYATEHTIEVAREATRQEFERLKAERATELQTVAKLAAEQAVNLVLVPEQRITR
jgi:hypothetical protein